MSSQNLSDPTQRWLITGNRLRSSNNTLLKIDASGSTSNLVLSKNDISLCTIGTNIDSKIPDTSIINTCATTIGTYDFSSNTNLNTYGAYYSFGSQATEVAFGNTSTQPSTGKPGYIRYNTQTYTVDYWSTLNNSWMSINQNFPTFTSITPNFVPSGVDASYNYTIIGTNFLSGATIKFISVSGGIEYNPFSGTSFITSEQLQARSTVQMSNDGGGVTGAGTLGYKIRIINPSGISYTTPSAVLTYNDGPIFITAANTNLGIGISGETYTYSTSPFTDLSAIDTGTVLHNPVKFYYSSGGNPSGASGVLLDPSGRLYGTMPTGFAGTSQTYSFTAYPLDNNSTYGDSRTFQFTIDSIRNLSISAGLSSYVTISYVNSSNTIVSSPVSGGYTIYTFKDSSVTAPGTTRTGSVTPNFTGSIEYLVVAGGGGGGSDTTYGGGGGAGGLLAGSTSITRSSSYSLTVGAGGAVNNNGSGSIFSSISTSGGGYGGTGNNGSGNSGGSGGGGAGNNFLPLFTVQSNFGTGTPGQGNNGGGGNRTTATDTGGGGGGAGSAGSPNNGVIGDNVGGNGVTSSISGISTFYAGGGGGRQGAGGPGGGGSGFPSGSINGTNGLGGGGGGGGGSGGSGIVILKFLSFA